MRLSGVGFFTTTASLIFFYTFRFTEIAFGCTLGEMLSVLPLGVASTPNMVFAVRAALNNDDGGVLVH